ncbi:hypothetical protein TKK_0000914 [Trichogramma kaykai]
MTTARTAAEEQVHGLGANPARRRTWRLGCNTDETAYHVVSSCITQEYTARHDCIVHHLIRSILTRCRHHRDEPGRRIRVRGRRVSPAEHRAPRENRGSEIRQELDTAHNRTNVNSVPKDLNISEVLGRMFKAPVKLTVMVVGALGEIVETPTLAATYQHLQQLGVTKNGIRKLEKQCSRSVAMSLAKIIMRRLLCGRGTTPP